MSSSATTSNPYLPAYIPTPTHALSQRSKAKSPRIGVALAPTNQKVIPQRRKTVQASWPAVPASYSLREKSGTTDARETDIKTWIRLCQVVATVAYNDHKEV